MKICFRCKKEKELECFGKHKERPDGLRGTCNECRAELRRKYSKTGLIWSERFPNPNPFKKGTKENKQEQRRREATRKGKLYFPREIRMQIWAKRKEERRERIKKERMKECPLCHDLYFGCGKWCISCRGIHKDEIKKKVTTQKIKYQKEKYQLDPKFRSHKLFRKRKYRRKTIENLAAVYLIECIRKKTSLNKSEIVDELVLSQREAIRAKRILAKFKKEIRR